MYFLHGLVCPFDKHQQRSTYTFIQIGHSNWRPIFPQPNPQLIESLNSIRSTVFAQLAQLAQLKSNSVYKLILSQNLMFHWFWTGCCNPESKQLSRERQKSESCRLQFHMELQSFRTFFDSKETLSIKTVNY